MAIATKDQIAEAARLLALNLAHYQRRYGDPPLENIHELLATQTMDGETAWLVATGMEHLVGILGMLTQNDESLDETLQ